MLLYHEKGNSQPEQVEMTTVITVSLFVTSISLCKLRTAEHVGIFGDDHDAGFTLSALGQSKYRAVIVASSHLMHSKV